jgi:methionyl-tRNA formyltransferase
MAVPEVAACQAALADLGVDLAIVFSFPLIPQSLTTVPHHGTVNLHPSLLPAYRGPNAFRSLYEGETRLGATLHHVTAEIDGGPVLAQSSEPTPEDPQPAAVAEILQRTATAVLETGVPRALADEAGEDQDRTASTAATRFREDEKLLDLSLTTHLFQCRATALILAGIQPSVLLGGEAHPLRAVRRLAGVSADQPGVVTLTSRRAIVALTNGVLELELGALPF